MIGLRQKTVPPGVLILKDNTNAITGFTLNCCYTGRHIKQVPNACTNPGSLVGAATHTHDAVDAHTHTASGSTCHTHVVNYSGGTGPQGGGAGGGSGAAYINHNHTVTSNSAATAHVSTATSATHTHNAACNIPKSRTYRVMTKSTNVGLNQSLPVDSLLIWSKTLSSIPSTFIQDCGLNTRLVKIHCCPGTDVCTTTHTHTSSGHTHLVTMTTHTHVLGSSGGASFSIYSCYQSTPIYQFSATAHTHTGGTAASTIPTATTACNGHTHDAQSFIPESIETTLIKVNNVSLRQQSIPRGASVLWDNPLADIPPYYALADGTLGTSNYLDKYIIGIPTACTNPGSTTGSHAHQHNSDCHNHGTTCIPHTHALSGTTGSALGGGGNSFGLNLGTTQAHTHALTGNSGDGDLGITHVGTSHQHASLDHKPLTVELAIIEKL